MTTCNPTAPKLTASELRLYDRLIARDAPAVLLKSSRKLTARGIAHIVSDIALAQIVERRLVAKGVSR